MSGLNVIRFGNAGRVWICCTVDLGVGSYHSESVLKRITFTTRERVPDLSEDKPVKCWHLYQKDILTSDRQAGLR